MITYYQANRILDRSFGNQNYTVPSPMYVGLSTTTIQNDGTGATEPTGGYARVSVTNADKTNWTTALNGVLSNVNSITFPESTLSWGTITYVFISDQATGGNIMYFDALSPSRAVQSATTVLFVAGAMVISMTN